MSNGCQSFLDIFFQTKSGRGSLSRLSLAKPVTDTASEKLDLGHVLAVEPVTEMKVRDCLVSAPGKAILHGEHAVVHGKVALAVSLNLRTYLHLKATSDGTVCINLPNIDTFLCWNLSELKQLLPFFSGQREVGQRLDFDLLKRLRDFMGLTNGNLDTSNMATLTFLYIYMSLFGSGELPSLKVSVWSELPTGAGLGSSAAYSVCLAAALLCASGAIPAPLKEWDHTARWHQEDLELINSWAFQGEMIIHGNPSGVDNTVATWGGMLRFLAGKIIPLTRVPLIRILLTNTKVPRSTKVLVARVKDRINKFPPIMIPVLDTVDAVSSTCEKVLTEMTREPITGEHYNTLEELIDINQHLLNVMGVGHPALDTVCRVTLAKGLHSKLTGAGGGGCGITLLRPETDSAIIQSTMQDLKDCGFDCWETSIGGPGVQQHSPFSIKEDILEILKRYGVPRGTEQEDGLTL